MSALGHVLLNQTHLGPLGLREIDCKFLMIRISYIFFFFFCHSESGMKYGAVVVILTLLLFVPLLP